MSKENITCENCKHWEKFTDSSGLRYYGPFGNCHSPKMVYCERNMPSDALAYRDYEGYKAGIYTGKDFGCIHWEKKQ